MAAANNITIFGRENINKKRQIKKQEKLVKNNYMIDLTNSL